MNKVIKAMSDAGAGMIAAFAIGSIALGIVLLGLGIAINFVFFK